MATTYAACPQCARLNRLDTEKARAKQPRCGQCGALLTLQDGVGNVSARQLQSLITSSPLPVVADFWADWCGPCKSFAPQYARAAHELGGKAVFVKVDTEHEPGAAAQHGVRSLPTVVVFKNGAEVKRQSGAMPLPMLKSWLQPDVS